MLLFCLPPYLVVSLAEKLLIQLFKEKKLHYNDLYCSGNFFNNRLISLMLRFHSCSRLSNCIITEEGYKALSSALRSNPSHLIELDLTGNDPGPSGVKQLNDLLQNPNCQLKTLR